MKLKNIHPNTKLMTAFMLIVLSFVFDARFTFLLIIPLCGIIHVTHYSLKTWWISWSFALPYIMMLTLITGFTLQSSQPLWFSFGSFSLNAEGLMHVLMRVKSIVALVFVTATIVIHTPRADILAAYPTPSWKASIAFLITSVLVNIQASQKQAKAILIAQQTRGVSTQGNLFKRMQSLWPLMMPIVIHSMMMNQQRQRTYLVRGYDIQKSQTLLHQCIKSKKEQMFEMLLVLFTGLILVFKVFL
jgi:energy-coupling factor transport system permease protein